jgi:hypothetical protein
MLWGEKTMKRIDMVTLILKEVNDRIPDLYSFWDERHADDLLSIIENAGMLPPLNEQEYHYMDNYDRTTVNAARPYFTWEPEDKDDWADREFNKALRNREHR